MKKKDMLIQWDVKFQTFTNEVRETLFLAAMERAHQIEEIDRKVKEIERRWEAGAVPLSSKRHSG